MIAASNCLPLRNAIGHSLVHIDGFTPSADAGGCQSAVELLASHQQYRRASFRGTENPRGGEAGANVRFAASGGNIGTTRATPIYAKRFTRSGPDVNDDTARSPIPVPHVG